MLTHALAFLHYVLRGDVDRSAHHYRRWLEVNGADSTATRETERRLRNPLTRDATLRQIARDAREPQTAAVIYRSLDGDEGAIAYLTRLASDPARERLSLATLAAYLGRLGADPRMRAALVRLGFPAP